MSNYSGNGADVSLLSASAVKGTTVAELSSLTSTQAHNFQQTQIASMNASQVTALYNSYNNS